MPLPKRLVIGFVAAALSVVIFHQGMILLMREIGMLPAAARVWSLALNPWGVPMLLNNCFWGGLYGAVFGAFAPILAPRYRVPMWVAGLLTGILATLVGYFIVAAIKGQPIGGGWVAMAWVRRLMIEGTFGIGIGVIYPQIAGRLLKAPLPRV